MRHLALIAVLALLVASAAQAEPRLTLSAYQVTPGTHITLRATGFTPRGIVISELIRPDGTEYPTMTFEADASGAFTHMITIVPPITGTYEVRMTDRDSKATTSTRFLMAAVGTAPLPKSQGEQMPQTYAGVWQGRATPKAGEASPVVVTLAGGSEGGVVGSVAYPSLLCGGELWLLGVYGDSIQLGERITYGDERCAARGVVTVRPERGGGLSFGWRDAYQPGVGGTVSGTLSRR